LSEPRTKITLTWRPAGAPARRHDDFIEIGGASATTRTVTPRPLQIVPARRAADIGRRLENWGMWANLDNRPGAGRAACMTGAICDSMRRHAAGVIGPAAAVHDRINVPDAELINAGMTRIEQQHRAVLNWTYVVCAKPWAVAGACGFPTCEYGERLAAAQAAIESVVNKNERTRG
jgi:hypothetical protein